MGRPRSQAAALARLFAAVPAPIYAVDDKLAIVYANVACCEWTQTPAEELLGLLCRYHSNSEASERSLLAAGLCPPPEALAGKRMRGAVVCQRPDGTSSRRGAEFIPLGSDALNCVGVLVLVDMTERDATPRLPRDPTPIELHEALQAMRQAAARSHCLERIVGESPAMRRVREQAILAQPRHGRVLVVGPSGSGRRHVAKAIHYGNAETAPGPITPIDAALLDAEMMQSALAAFLRRRRELGDARAGSLLLLEVDQLSPAAQSELANFLSLPEMELHFLATAQRPLLGPLAPEGFRTDLAHALSTLVIELPSLAERMEDIPLLAQHFVEEHNRQAPRQLGGFSPEALDVLCRLPWPENVAELARCVAEACERAEGVLIQPSDLPTWIEWSDSAARHPLRDEPPIQLDAFLAQIEQELIDRALAKAKGNKTLAAQLLGVSRARLHRRKE